MARAAKRLVGPKQLANATATEYTTPTYIPAAQTTVIRHIHLANPTAGTVTVTCGIGADAAGTRILDALPLLAGEHRDIYVYVPLTSGELFKMHASAATSIVATVSGDENVG